MPDNSDRLRATSLEAMSKVLFTLNSIHKKADISNHPKLIVVFNDVSLYESVGLDKMDEHLKKVNEPQAYKEFKGRQVQI